MQQVESIVGQIVERDLVAVVDGLFEPREERVVELVHFGHGGGHPRVPAFGFGGQAPVFGVALQLGECAGQQGIRHGHTPAGAEAFSRRYASTQSTTTLCRWRTRISWSLSGNPSTMPYSSAACVPP